MQKKKKSKSLDEQKERHEWNVLKKRVTDERFKEIESFGLGELDEVGSRSEQISGGTSGEED